MKKVQALLNVVITHYKNRKKAPELSRMLAFKVYRPKFHRYIREFNRIDSRGLDNIPQNQGNCTISCRNASTSTKSRRNSFSKK